MPTRRLDDLIIWQVARDIAAEIYRQTLDDAFDRDPHLRSELRRSACAVMANIAVGYQADTEDSLAHGFNRAALAAAELSSLVQLTTDLDVLRPPVVAGMLVRVSEVSRLIRGWQRALRTQRLAGRPVSTRVN